MGVPRLKPFIGVLLDACKEQVMDEPNVRRIGGIQAVVDLQIPEEVLPLLPETASDIVPQAFNASIVDTSE